MINLSYQDMNTTQQQKLLRITEIYIMSDVFVWEIKTKQL